MKKKEKGGRNQILPPAFPSRSKTSLKEAKEVGFHLNSACVIKIEYTMGYPHLMGPKGQERDQKQKCSECGRREKGEGE